MTQITHSNLGASGAYRWMNCGGSVELSKLVAEQDDYSVDPVYRLEGTAAHAVAAMCLAKGMDAWELGDIEFDGVPASKLELECVQTFVDYCRSVMHDDTDNIYIEHSIGEKVEDRPHPAFFGTVDFAAFNTKRLIVPDFKYGAGVAVGPERNPQIMYYAYGILRDMEKAHGPIADDFPVTLVIVQPRTFEDKDIKTWETTAGEIFEWAREELLPKMNNPGVAYAAGEHCRFCPAKIACPLLKGMFAVAATVNTSWVKDAHPSALGQEWLQIAPVKMYLKAVEDECYNRLNAGVVVDGTKLVQKKSNRVWKDGALAEITKEFGDLAMTAPELKSPSAIAALGEGAKAMVDEWAYSPNTGYTVAAADSKKAGVKMKTAQETFAVFVKP